jgi:hypothetical protein
MSWGACSAIASVSFSKLAFKVGSKDVNVSATLNQFIGARRQSCPNVSKRAAVK